MQIAKEDNFSKIPVQELNSFLPDYQWWTQHSIIINATPKTVILAFRELNNSDLGIARLLFTIRMLPSMLFNPSYQVDMEAKELVWNSMLKIGFIELDGTNENTAILGFIGKPWKLKLSNSIRKDVNTQQFVSFIEPGYIKGVNSVIVKPHAEGTLLTTETRVFATCQSAEKRFKPYWFFIKPFSGLMRINMLSSIAGKAKKIQRLK